MSSELVIDSSQDFLFIEQEGKSIGIDVCRRIVMVLMVSRVFIIGFIFFVKQEVRILGKNEMWRGCFRV